MFLYAFISRASISFLHLLLCSLNEVHRSCVIGHALIHPIFIHRILLFLGLDGFPSGDHVHVVAPIGATFLRQRAAHLRVAPSRPRGVSSGAVPLPPFSTGGNADVPPSTTSDDSDIRRTLDHILTVQAAHGQILVDVLDEIRACVRSWRSLDHLPFNDGFCLPFGIPSQKGRVLCSVFRFQGEYFFFFGACGV